MKASKNRQGRLSAYYRLTKPGIIRGNVFTGVAGFLFACGWPIDWRLLISFTGSLVLIIASACVFNNYIDRDVDRRMERTRTRALVQGSISPQAALVFATLLGVTGFSWLAVGTNLLTLVLGLIAYVDYIVAYGWAKRHTVHGTLGGTISGSIPPAAGYTAVTGSFDFTAFLLFFIMVSWQMAQFYAIALYRLKDYDTVDIPVYPAVRGAQASKTQILLYITLFGISTVLLTVFSTAPWAYAVVMLLVSAWWLYKSSSSLKSKTDTLWGKSVFLMSLVVLTTWSVAVALSGLLR